MNKVICALLILVALLIAACCSLPGSTCMDEKTRTVVDAKGTKVVVPAKPQRVVSLTLGTDEMLLDLLPEERVLCVTSLADDPTISHVTQKSAHVPHKIKGIPNAEMILALKPDLVIAADWWNLEAVDYLREMGIPVYVYKTPYTIKAVPDTVMEVAKVVGAEYQGKILVKQMEKDLQQLQSQVAKKKINGQPKLMIVANHGILGGKGSLFDDMCSYLEIDNCMRNIKTGGSGTISKETFLEQNPDVILCVDWAAPGSQKTQNVENIVNDTSLAEVNAVKKHKVLSISGKTVYCVSHYMVQGLRDLAGKVYQ